MKPKAPSQDFSASTLKWMRKWKSQGHLTPFSGSYPISDSEWKTFFDGVSTAIHEDTFSFSGMHTARVKGNTILTTKYLDEALVLRKINDNIRRCYGIRQPNRQDLIRTVKQALKENTPKTIIRIDLKKCFESISRQWLIKKLEDDGLISLQTVTLLKQLFKASEKLKPEPSKTGLPRGIIVSTSLAELRLRELDKKLRDIHGVYLVLRYVDDILVFSTASIATTKLATDQAIESSSLSPNTKKGKEKRIGCACEYTCTHTTQCPCKKGCSCYAKNPNSFDDFEYLGYKFIHPIHNITKSENPVYCVISDRKISRIKTRIHKAIAAYKKIADGELLERRIKYLTSNQALSATPGKRSLFNGLSYTHSEYAPPTHTNIYDKNKIEELDRHYQTLLRNVQAGMPSALLSKLKRLSFKSGFLQKRRTKFMAIQIIAINRCWENA